MVEAECHLLPNSEENVPTTMLPHNHKDTQDEVDKAVAAVVRQIHLVPMKSDEGVGDTVDIHRVAVDTRPKLSPYHYPSTIEPDTALLHLDLHLAVVVGDDGSSSDAVVLVVERMFLLFQMTRMLLPKVTFADRCYCYSHDVVVVEEDSIHDEDEEDSHGKHDYCCCYFVHPWAKEVDAAVTVQQPKMVLPLTKMALQRIPRMES